MILFIILLLYLAGLVVSLGLFDDSEACFILSLFWPIVFAAWITVFPLYDLGVWLRKNFS